MERLQKVLAHAGVASRRKSEQFIIDGKVKVNGEIVTELGVKVDPEQDFIEVNGQSIQKERLVYYTFHKPIEVITSVDDPLGRKVVTDYFKRVQQRIYPVGRLDYATTGLLLLTNDGELSHKLTHPSFHVEKTYLATVKGIVSDHHLERLRTGIRLEDGVTSPAKADRMKVNEKRNQTELRIKIYEGRNRQVRRMCEAIGHPVQTLHRSKYGFLTLQNLQPGEYRQLTKEEVKRLKALPSHNFQN